jgi:hypothetical protein
MYVQDEQLCRGVFLLLEQEKQQQGARHLASNYSYEKVGFS